MSAPMPNDAAPTGGEPPRRGGQIEPAGSGSRDTDFDVEALLSEVLRPIEPPETLALRLEGALARITEAAADELADWEIEAMSDPRNWVRPMAAAAVGGAAATGLVLFELRRRRREHGLKRVVTDVSRWVGAPSGAVRRRRSG